MVERAMTSDELITLFNPLVYRELAAIGAIDTAIPSEDDPGYVTLHRAAKQGKQANVEQMSALIRSVGGQPVQTAKALQAMLKMQTTVTKFIGTIPTLTAMRLAQLELTAAYERAFSKLAEEETLARKCVEKCWHRAVKQLMILTVHVEGRYTRACMRCHLDRPGHLGAIERTDPHPYQLICAGCHDEVMRDFPADLIDQINALDDYDRRSLVIEKALGRPSTLTCEHEVLSKLSDLPPDMPAPPIARKVASYARLDVITAPPPEIDLQIHTDAGSLDERLYIELLFDLRSVRRNW
jgi:hypothetical protein